MFGVIGFILGIILILVGGTFIFIFPSSTEYQPKEFSHVIILAGFVMVILGAILMFV